MTGIPAANRRVLLVEDDASIARFVAMALEDLGVDLVVCADVQSALAALKAHPAQLVITDLMLPGLSGFDLLERLQADPGLRGPAKVAIFSAGINAAVMARLNALPMWCVLRKPASVAQLQGCVRDALAAAATARSGDVQAGPPAPDQPDERGGDCGGDADAITTYFAGNAALFHTYRARCLAQFTNDLVAGDGALAAGDLAALQRLSHSLSTVFRTLGWAADSVAAKRLEALAAAGDARACANAWAHVRGRLQGGRQAPAVGGG